jgi:hypothetical protein
MLGEEPPLPIERMAQFDHGKPFGRQVARLVDGIGLSPAAWQTTRILLNPPGFAPIAVALLAELHGRMGYFPAIVRMRPIPNSVPPEYEVAEIINLQAVRDQARRERAEKDV